MINRARILAIGLLAVLAGGGTAVALSDGDPASPVPTTGPFTQTMDRSREDYWDQITHEVPINRIAGAAEATFGPRLADIAIDREPDPDVLQVYVVDATAADEAELTQIAEGDPQVALQSAEFTFEQLLAAKEAVADAAPRVDSLMIEPDFLDQRVSVTSVRELGDDLKARIRRAAGDIPVGFAFGPQYRVELLASP